MSYLPVMVERVDGIRLCVPNWRGRSADVTKAARRAAKQFCQSGALGIPGTLAFPGFGFHVRAESHVVCIGLSPDSDADVRADLELIEQVASGEVSLAAMLPKN